MMKPALYLLGLLLTPAAFAAGEPESFLLQRLQCGGSMDGNPRNSVLYFEEMSDGATLYVRGQQIADDDYGQATRGNTTYLSVHFKGGLSHRFAIDLNRKQAQEGTFPGQGAVTPVGKPIPCKIEEGNL